MRDIFVPSFELCSEPKAALNKLSPYKEVLEPNLIYYVNRKLEVR